MYGKGDETLAHSALEAEQRHFFLGDIKSTTPHTLSSLLKLMLLWAWEGLRPPPELPSSLSDCASASSPSCVLPVATAFLYFHLSISAQLCCHPPLPLGSQPHPDCQSSLCSLPWFSWELGMLSMLLGQHKPRAICALTKTGISKWIQELCHFSVGSSQAFQKTVFLKDISLAGHLRWQSHSCCLEQQITLVWTTSLKMNSTKKNKSYPSPSWIGTQVL